MGTTDDQSKPTKITIPYQSYLELIFGFIADKGMAVALLAALSAFFAYDKVKLQPERDKVQREHETAMQAAWKGTTIEIIDRLDKESERWRLEQSTQNELWRQAVLQAKFGQTDMLRELMQEGGQGG